MSQRPTNKRAQPGGMRPEHIAMFVLGGVVLVALVIVYAAIKAGHWIGGVNGQTPADPFDLFSDLVGGKVAWPGESTGVVIGLVLTLGLLWWLFAKVVKQQTKQRSRVDDAARYLGRTEDVVDLTEKATKAASARLTSDPARCGPGIPIGRSVSDGQMLYGSWEDMHIDIWGPRTGKTTSRAIPALLAAPGAALATSNKRDLVDATRGVREQVGPVWVFDPQDIAGERPRWWWNPLDFVVDEMTASELAGHFAAAGRDPEAKTDAYFDPAAETLLAGFFLAAALDNRPITDVLTWLAKPLDETPADLLTKHGLPLKADELAAVRAAPEKQREGIMGTARQMASCLTIRSVARWVTPRAKHDPRPRFDPKAFVKGTGTLYSLSREGAGNAGALVTALTVATTHAAEAYAATCPGGRLPIPMVGILDEIANVCRWRLLPQNFSFYGSKGIILLAIFQSWSQGARIFTEAGMSALWSAANVKVYGGGVHEEKFLEQLSKLVGDYDKQSRSAQSDGRGGPRSVTHQLNRERILPVADLASMPKGRALVIGSGSRPTLIKTQPWMAGKDAKAVQASIDTFSPAGQPA